MPQHTITLNSPFGRVRLIPPGPDDDEAVKVIHSHPRTLQYMRFYPSNVSIEDIRSRRASRAENPAILDFHVHLLNDDGTTTFAGAVGMLQIDETHSSCHAGIAISPEVHRRGIGTEALYTLLKFAFEERKIHRVAFETSEENLPMRSWLEEVLGAKLEAEKRECWKVDTGYINARGYSLLDREWTGLAKERVEKYMSSKIQDK